MFNFKNIALGIVKPFLADWLKNRALRIPIASRIELQKKYPALTSEVFDAIESVGVSNAVRELDHIKL